MTTKFDSGDYGLYQDREFRHRWLRPVHWYEKLRRIEEHPSLQLEELGRSVEDRPINIIKWGQGKTRLLLWTQMHGNEPTATMAVVDLLNFLTANDRYNDFREELAQNLELHIIPMLNPDGSERFSRLNALAIDLNRDALSLVTPELRALLVHAREAKPHWAFNLHDQRNIFTAGKSRHPATISFLAASASERRDITPERETSMKLIAELADLVEFHIPNHCAKYPDEFYPRALGEYFHGQQIPCVLIESGPYPGDEFRDQARKMNFLCLLHAFDLIISGSYKEVDIAHYLSIPDNRTNGLDLVIRHCELKHGKETFRVDLGFLYKEIPNHDTGVLERKLYLNSVGDLRHFFGLEEQEGGEVDLKETGLEIDKEANITVHFEDRPSLKIKDGKWQN